MNDNRFALVEFQGDQLLTIFDGQTVRVAMKPLVERLGISWPRQSQKLKEDAVLSKGVALTAIPSDRGAQETITLPIDLMQGWLFKLNPDKVAPEARERVIAYQRECYQVLHDYWVRGAAINPRFGTSATSGATDLLKLTDRLKHEWHPEIKAMLHTLLGQMCDRMNLPLPRIEAFGQPAPDDLEIADGFFAGLIDLKRAGVEFDHHRRADLLAVSLPQLERLFATAAIDAPRGAPLRRALRQHPAFIEAAAVNGRDTRIRRCWIFDRSKLPELDSA